MIVLKGQYPPNYKQIAAAFPVADSTVFTYGEALYAPRVTCEISNDLMEHEAVHTRQQGSSPDAWWNRYIADPQFRLTQELEAYRAQYRYYKATPEGKRGNNAFRFALILARDLSGPLYGLNIDPYKAFRMIKS